MNELIEEEIIYINKSWISLYGGIYFEASNNILNKNSFDYLLEAQNQVVFGVQQYPTLFEKAAIFPFFIIKDHIFADGNKRTGMVAAFLFLGKNGYEISENVRSKRITNYAERIASCKPNIENITRWLRKISKAIG